MVDFGSDFSSDFKGVPYKIRIRPTGSDSEDARESYKYEWTVDEEAQTAYSMPVGIPAEDVTITELDSTDANALADRIHAETELVHHTTFEKAVI